MSEDKSIKLIKAVKELNIGMSTIVDFLATKGYKVDKQPMAKLDNDMYSTLLKEFAVDKSIKEEAKQISIGKIRKEEPGITPDKPLENRRSRDFENEEILIKNAGNFTAPPAPVEKPQPAPTPEPAKAEEAGNTDALPGVKIVGKIDLNNLGAKPVEKVKEETPKPEPVAPKVEPKEEVKAPEPVVEAKKEVAPEAPKAEDVKASAAPTVTAPPVVTQAPVATPAAEPANEEGGDPDVIRAKAARLSGPNIVGKITLPVVPKRNPVASSSNTNADHKRKRKRKDNQGPGQGGNNNGQPQQGTNPAGGGNAPQGGGNNTGNNNANRPDFRNRPNNTGGGYQGNRPNNNFNRNAPASTG
ncbi:MAG: translation initiation factor, partial [Mucilaginibacter sp.]|nr:translation initiation factor [Mucilaginibacter sp.]